MPGQQRQLDREDQRLIAAALRGLAKLDPKGFPRLTELAKFIDPKEEATMTAEGRRLNWLVDNLEATRDALDKAKDEGVQKDETIADLQQRLSDATPDADDIKAEQRADAWIDANAASVPANAPADENQPAAPETPARPVTTVKIG